MLSIRNILSFYLKEQTQCTEVEEREMKEGLRNRIIFSRFLKSVSFNVHNNCVIFDVSISVDRSLETGKERNFLPSPPCISSNMSLLSSVSSISRLWI